MTPKKKQGENKPHLPFECKLCGGRFESALDRTIHQAMEHDIVSKERALELALDRRSKAARPQPNAECGGEGETSTQPILHSTVWKPVEEKKREIAQVPVSLELVQQMERIFAEAEVRLARELNERLGLLPDIGLDRTILTRSDALYDLYFRGVCVRRKIRVTTALKWLSQSAVRDLLRDEDYTLIKAEMRRDGISSIPRLGFELRFSGHLSNGCSTAVFGAMKTIPKHVAELLEAGEDTLVHCPLCPPPKRRYASGKYLRKGLRLHLLDAHKQIPITLVNAICKVYKPSDGSPQTPALQLQRRSDSLDATRNYHARREHGRFGSYPSHDDFDN